MITILLSDLVIFTLGKLIKSSYLTVLLTDLLGAVGLLGLKFIQFKTYLNAARVLYHSNSIKKRATMSKHVLNEP